MAKKDYTNWDRKELIKEIDQLRKRKKYGLVWEDKPENVVEQCKTELPVLEEVKSKEIITDPDKPVNLLIEGDNYHALSVLNYTHKGKIDVIYIDPPYNTGNKDFVYNDNYIDREDSFRHSKWLSFMSNRLKLAKNLLKNTGVIFISIDDNEMAQLKVLCDEIFGEELYVAIFPWKKRSAKSDVPNGISQDYEWVLCYAKENFRAGITHNRKYYYTDDYPNDGWRLSDITTQKNERDRPNSAFDLVNPKTGKIYKYNPNRLWGITKDTFQFYYDKGKIVFPEDYNFLKIKIPAYRVFESEDKAKALKKYGSEDSIKAISTAFPKEVGMSQDGNKELVDLFGEKVFSFPKPTSLISYLLEIISNKNSVVLDFMAGTGTTGHAIINLNKKDGGSRSFILCTNNELNGVGSDLAKENPNENKESFGICQRVCYPRLEKVIKGYKNNKNEKIDGLGENLKYFITSFVPADPTDKNKIALTEKTAGMLCVKEDTFEEVRSTKQYKIFRNKKRYTGIIFDHQAIDDLKKEIAKIDGKFSLYVFSLSNDDYSEEFADLKKKARLSPIPEAILKVYREIFKPNRK